ncbi:putative RNA uridine N3 methyltransferase [Desulfurococcus amylolyticus]|uniref:DUF171 domain containing protein n=1 Tax=Desulfurococcus amylolyticus (strain DSM 18924 / JCM 16383 / VKM B-2413 / 1221n) TaxID=490899 RepID=B8D5X3_DESA1|nr:putative RNA uridine N3 methyltransferase [Desulfurococcus amylolyticus]ACL11504.1 DUF171 domain containing protein [Desulfurococcus amylolyticus 1221n]
MARIGLSIVLPTSILSVEPTLFLKSLRIHQVARWSSIFGVNRVVFYREYETSRDEFREHREIISIHWRYFFTPPYLRRRLVPRNPLLRYVGALPPIRLSEFNVSGKPVDGEERIGFITLEEGKLTAYLDNVEKYSLVNPGDCKQGFSRVKVVDSRRKLAECIDTEYYIGPSLVFRNSLREALDEAGEKVFIIATDKTGEAPSLSNLASLKGRMELMLLFGSPERDLFEISRGEGFNLLEYVDAVWNTVPGQHVVSVRTEEAVIITLGLLNYWLKKE